MSSPRRRLAVVLLATLLPWTVVLFGDEATFVFSFGLVNTNPPRLVNLYDYLFVFTDGLPRRLQAWPAGFFLHAGALASASTGLRDAEDPRLTGGLLLFAGFAHAQVAAGLYRTYGGAAGPLVLPVGALVAWAVVWWYYWPLVRKRGLVTERE